MTPKDMMVVDANAEVVGIPRSSLMENAGRCLAHIISEISKPCKVVIFAGNGGNGGDGFVAARYLLNWGFKVEVYLLSHPSRIKSKESRANWEVLQKISIGLNPLKIRIIEDSSSLESTGAGITGGELTGDGVLVDAILGTGIEGRLREPVSSAIDLINNLKGVKIAVDVPSGLDPLTGYVEDKAVEADLTVTFHKPKTGLKNARKECVGSIRVCDIGIPEEVELFTGPGDLLRLKKRDEKSHKGQNGRVLVLGGSRDYSGAPALAALASLRSGADLALVACPTRVSSAIRSYSADLIVKNLSDDLILPKDIDEILKLSKNVDSLVIGCGMGRADETAVALNDLVEKIVKPVVIDADALKLLDLDLIKNSENEMVLTPH
jgi:ADP-dependent NAD(P)H-hydrate dehydratase / NAD(P)H-hydrate epimerase